MIYFEYKERGTKMKRKVILATHGSLAQALLETTQMIIGPHEDMLAVGLQAGMAPEAYKETLEEVFLQYPDHEFLVLIDI